MTNYEPSRFAAEAAARLRGLIARYEMSQDDLARLCDVSQSQFSKIIRGLRPLTIDQLAAICDALDIDLVELVTEVEGFMADRMENHASPLQWVEDGERLESPRVRPAERLDRWARAALDRLDVGEARDDYDLVANETVDEAPKTTDADFDHA